jgi:hypothetical protein
MNIQPIFWLNKQVIQWIISLDDGRYKKYLPKFKFTTGLILRYMNFVELNEKIADDEDRDDFEIHLRQLFPMERKLLFPHNSREQMLDSMTIPLVEINYNYDA